MTDCQDSAQTVCCWGKEKTEPSTPRRLQWKTKHPEVQEKLGRERAGGKKSRKDKEEQEKQKLEKGDTAVKMSN